MESEGRVVEAASNFRRAMATLSLCAMAAGLMRVGTHAHAVERPDLQRSGERFGAGASHARLSLPRTTRAAVRLAFD